MLAASWDCYTACYLQWSPIRSRPYHLYFLLIANLMDPNFTIVIRYSLLPQCCSCKSVCCTPACIVCITTQAAVTQLCLYQWGIPRYPARPSLACLANLRFFFPSSLFRSSSAPFLYAPTVVALCWQWAAPTSQPSGNQRSGPSMGRRNPFTWVLTRMPRPPHKPSHTQTHTGGAYGLTNMFTFTDSQCTHSWHKVYSVYIVQIHTIVQYIH